MFGKFKGGPDPRSPLWIRTPDPPLDPDPRSPLLVRPCIVYVRKRERELERSDMNNRIWIVKWTGTFNFRFPLANTLLNFTQTVLFVVVKQSYGCVVYMQQRKTYYLGLSFISVTLTQIETTSCWDYFYRIISAYILVHSHQRYTCDSRLEWFTSSIEFCSGKTFHIVISLLAPAHERGFFYVAHYF